MDIYTSEKKVYKVCVPSGIDSVLLTWQEAMEYVFDCNADWYIINLETGELITDEHEQFLNDPTPW